MATRRCVLAAMAVLALFIAADTVFAGELKISGPTYRRASGGEFLVTEWDNGLAPGVSTVVSPVQHWFHTFCVETNEEVTLGNYYKYDIDVEAINGGSGGPSPDPLDKKTALLYYTYWTGQWDVADDEYNISLSYDYSTSGNSSSQRALDGEALQRAIWALEEEITVAELGTGKAKDFYDYAIAIDGDSAGWSNLGQSNWTDIGNVRVVNLYTQSVRAEWQSQLVVVPLPPGAFLGFSLLGCLGVVRALRRRIRLN